MTKIRHECPYRFKTANSKYDEWDGEFGGICDQIAESISSILSDVGIDTVEGGHDGDDHAWVLARIGSKVYIVDIPPHIYERGGGYNWQKIPDVKFQAGDVQISDAGVTPEQAGFYPDGPEEVARSL